MLHLLRTLLQQGLEAAVGAEGVSGGAGARISYSKSPGVTQVHQTPEKVYAP